jgi:hypothetical protein
MAAPPKPTVSSQHEFDMLDDAAKARLLYAWSEFWLGATPAAGPTNPGTRIVIPAPPTDGETISTEGWKQAPSAEERESLRANDWKKY